jgi:small subunit ribosomal protein S9
MTAPKIANPDISVTDAPTIKAAEPVPQKSGKKKDKGGFWWGTGRRKTSVARVRIKPGEGKLLINDKELADYFRVEKERTAVLAPLVAVDGLKKFDVFVNAKGGGIAGQAGATSLGIARALKIYDENYLQVLRDGKHLTRDSRMVERKKPGQSGARKRYQFSKR